MAASLDPGFVDSTSLYICSALAGSVFASFCASAIRLPLSATAMMRGRDDEKWFGICEAGDGVGGGVGSGLMVGWRAAVLSFG